MADLHDQTAAAARTVLADNGASAPNVDTDTLAGLIATAVIEAARQYTAANLDPAAELANAPVPETDDPGTLVGDDVADALDALAPKTDDPPALT